MEIYVFNRNLEFIGMIDSFTSLIWTRRYYKSGEFELHCDLTPQNLKMLERGNIIYKTGDVEAGYIEYRNFKQDTEGKEILVIKGKFLTSYFNRRIIWGTEVFNITAELAMRNLVTDNCISPINTSRIIHNMMLGTLNGFIETVDYQVSYANLSDELENLSNISNLGHRVNFDINSKKLVFEVYKGLDRSVNQSSNPRCIFSKEYDNILEQEYVDSLNNYKNLVLVGGIGEGSERRLVTIGDSVGLDRFEVFADQKSLANTEDINGVSTVMSDVDYNLLLSGKGNETLALTKEIQTFDSKINLNSNLTYKTDYNLGDIITIVSKKWGITFDSRINEIQEVYEENGLSINITFGNNIPTIMDKIKQKLKLQSNSSGSNGNSNTTITNIDGGSF
ncbi:siphovirus ReqiPepy6 Gp37-like family protein [Clostridium estertheticum]|uniref:Siphovirus ReqiPepy6 Gp37-like family protein n=1 Tax=Clostridium estertheticum TaxID=238834 RepID=A0AA47EK14_9CLOT|nr:siphovirus ReqiPepy6 Gp37-like family protein [Clostridium estertheticum]MBU3153893.1 siphovirus ReqiPepy6 Gp37-like family protein [Clostridium estertheticum]WAG61331.1 siphovirus ReqiPepy6 Gp37-like family protein [Clostridium estertheticum]